MSPESPYLGQNTQSAFSGQEIVVRIIWAVIQATVFKWSPRPWHGFRARLLRLFGAKISHPGKVVIFPSVRVTFPWRLRLEPRTMIGRNVTLYNLAPITLHYGANISQNCHLCAGSHNFDYWDMPLTHAPITIRENVWVAADVFIGPGVTIGQLAVIGARSVVMKDQPESMVCVGHPCKPVRPRQPPTLRS